MTRFYVLIVFIFSHGFTCPMAYADTLEDILTQTVSVSCGLEVDTDLPDAFLKVLSEDLLYLSQMKGSVSPLASHEKFFKSKSVDGKAYCIYLKENIDAIYFKPEMEEGIAAANNSFSGKIVINPYFFIFSRIDRLSTLIHEARHTGNLKTMHVACDDKSLKTSSGLSLYGLPACDDQLEGAYGYQYIWLQSIAGSCESCTLEERVQAKGLAALALERIQPLLLTPYM